MALTIQQAQVIRGWWGTIIATSGWDPAPWQSKTGWGSPKVIWYWAR